MMLDYYKILNINQRAGLEEIKQAYKLQAKKWHPDKNNKDTTSRMQNINEAFLILSDSEARYKYDQEYKEYKTEHSNKSNSNFNKSETYNNGFSERYDSMYEDYVIKNEILKKWIKNARKQAINLTKQSIEDFVGITRVASKAAFNSAKRWFLVYLIIQILFFLVIMLLK